MGKEKEQIIWGRKSWEIWGLFDNGDCPKNYEVIFANRWQWSWRISGHGSTTRSCWWSGGFAKEKLAAERFQCERNNLVFWVACFGPLDIFSWHVSCIRIKTEEMGEIWELVPCQKPWRIFFFFCKFFLVWKKMHRREQFSSKFLTYVRKTAVITFIK